MTTNPGRLNETMKKVISHMNKPRTIENLDKSDKIVDSNDGIEFINVHNRGKHELGRMLSQYYVAQFEHPYFGPFQCLEGFWFYLRSGCADDKFRSLNGYLSKERGKERELLKNTKLRLSNRHRELLLTSASYAKIDQHPEIKEALVSSTLPFEHYYLWNDTLPIRPDGAEKVIARFEKLREMFQKGIALDPIDYKSIIK